MKDETRIRSAAGRKVLADPRTHRYYLCLNDEEDEKFRYMLTHIKIRLGRIKGLKGLFYVLFSRTGCALPATKVDSFFCPCSMAYHANTRQ